MLTTSFPRYEGDSAGHFVLELSSALSRTHTVMVVAPGMGGLPTYEMVRNVKVLRFHYFFPRGFQKLAYGEGIIDNLRKNALYSILIPFFGLSFLMKGVQAARHCDVIHAHWAFSGLVAVVGKVIHKKPIVLSLRGSDVNVNLVGRRNSKLFLKWVMKGCDCVTTVSEDMLGKIGDCCGTNQKVVAVPNGISFEVFFPTDRSQARSTLGLSEEIQIVLFAGRITESKGADSLVEAMPAVLRERKKAVFVMLGEGNMVGKLLQFCRRRGIESSIVLPGSRPHGEMPIWLNAADLLVLPSLSEGRPNIVMEAMACGIPVVATRVGGTPELVKEGENGFLVPPKDPESLSRAILAVLNMKNGRETLGRRGREMVGSLGLDWEASAEKMAEIYETVVGEC